MRGKRTEKLQIFRLEASAIVAQDAMMLEDTSAYSRCDMEEIERLISEAKTHLKEFRVTHFNLSQLLGDEYSQDRREQSKILSNEAQVNPRNFRTAS